MIECLFCVPQVGGSIHGELLCSITIPSSTCNVGLACNSEGSLLAVSNFASKEVSVLTIDSDPAIVLHTFGGSGNLPGRFNEPGKVGLSLIMSVAPLLALCDYGIPREVFSLRSCVLHPTEICSCARTVISVYKK